MNRRHAERPFGSHLMPAAVVALLLIPVCSPVASALDSLDALLPTPHLMRSRADDLNLNEATFARIEEIYKAAEPKYHELKRELEEHTLNLDTSLRKDPHFNNHFDRKAIAQWVKALLEVENRLKLHQVRVRVRLLSQITSEQRQKARNYSSEKLEESRWRGVIAEGTLDTMLPTPFWLRSRAEELGVDVATREQLEQTYQELEPRYHELKKRLEPLTGQFLEVVLTDQLDEELIVKRFTSLLQAETELKLHMVHVRGSLLSLLTAEQRRAAQKLSVTKPKADWRKVLADKVGRVRQLGKQLVAKKEPIADIEQRLTDIQETISEGLATEGGRQLSQLIGEMEERLKGVTDGNRLVQASTPRDSVPLDSDDSPRDDAIGADNDGKPKHVTIPELTPGHDGVDVIMSFEIAKTFGIRGGVPKGQPRSFGITPVVAASDPRFSVLVSGELAAVMERFGYAPPRPGDPAVGLTCRAKGKIRVFPTPQDKPDLGPSYQFQISDWKEFRILKRK